MGVELKKTLPCITEKHDTHSLQITNIMPTLHIGVGDIPLDTINRVVSQVWLFIVLSLLDLLSRETPLHVAIHMGFPHLSHFLLLESEGQRMVPIVDKEGHSPLTLAQKYGDPTLISALTEWVTPSSLTQYTIIRLHVTSVIDPVYSRGWVSCVLWLCYDQSLELQCVEASVDVSDMDRRLSPASYLPYHRIN